MSIDVDALCVACAAIERHQASRCRDRPRHGRRCECRIIVCTHDRTTADELVALRVVAEQAGFIYDHFGPKHGDKLDRFVLSKLREALDKVPR